MRLAAIAAFVSLAASSSLASTTWSQEGVTPADRAPSLQEAIYAASPGTTLFADRYLPQVKEHIRVDRPLTLVGGAYNFIEFNGPGSGHASLIGAIVLPDYGSPDYSPREGIYASGFEIVGVFNSFVQASGYSTYAAPTGAPALRVDGQTTLFLVGSTLHATIGGGILEATCAGVYGGSAAVLSPGAVYAQSCHFFGGGSVANLWCEDDCPDGPLFTAPGAPGLIANRLWHRNCQFIGGPGAWWWNHPDVGDSGPGYIVSKELAGNVIVR